MPLAPFLAAVLAAAPVSRSPDRLDALGFDNGAMLISDGGAYAAGLGQYGTWAFTDGDEAQFWCSPKGQPTGLAYVWDLDTTWSLTTLTLSTRNVEESGYPGISARSVELHVGDGAAFRPLGTFQIGRLERKEFSLPKGTVARQVKLIVTANHGNPDFTEVAEVELLGTRTGKVEPPRIAGDFSTTYGPIRVAVEGDEVYGCYDHVPGATLFGRLVGRNARVTWAEPRGDDGVREGTATFAVSPDGGRLQGVWYEHGQLAGEWSGARIARAEGAQCTPRRRSQLETLRAQKRLVLYGIRFDSDADEPRAESAATLDEVAGLLREAPALRLLVEGHTDSTNTDAYNLDLSQRRAGRVLAALVKRGAAPERLQAKGFGRTRPVADNATASGRALNRRVEVSIIE